MIARSLGPHDMGRYSYAVWVASTLGALANLGFPATLTKYVAESRGRGNELECVQTARRLLRVQLLWVLWVSCTAACCLFVRPRQWQSIALISVMIVPQVLQQSLLATLAGAQQFKAIARLGLWACLTQVCLVGAAALLQAGTLGMLAATAASIAVNAVMYFEAVKSTLLGRGSNTPTPAGVSLTRRIRRFWISVSYIVLLDMVVWQRSEVFFLGHYCSPSTVAYYTLAYSISTKLNEAGGIVSRVMLPLFSASFGRNGVAEFGHIYCHAVKYCQLVIVPAALFGSALAPFLVRALYGDDYSPAILPLQIMFATTAITGVGAVGSPLLVGAERQRFMAQGGTLIACLNIALDLFLIPTHGLVGAAVANCVAQIAGIANGTVYLVRTMHVSFPARALSCIYGAAVVSVLPIHYISGRYEGFAAVLGATVLGIMTYACIVWGSGALSVNELRFFFTSMAVVRGRRAAASVV